MRPSRFTTAVERCALLTALTLTSFSTTTRAQTAEKSISPPPVQREFRAAWISSVFNGNWPSQKGLPVKQQKAELLAMFDKAAELNLNAIVLQVRPSCDAMYDSKIEPWSEFLTGEMGRAPSPYYDPLEFAVTEAHKRGLELHAWFNPYRARVKSSSSTAKNHVSNTHPNIVRQYGTMQWLDPAEPETRAYSQSVIMDVVRRYDIDGVHFDDYFYPYKQKDPKSGKILDFPDDAPWSRYKSSGGALTRDDWRREQVNVFIQQLYGAIKGEKPWVKFGISPFGIWQPGYPPQIRGMNAFSTLYADSRKWFASGWVDYFSPQLYWPIDQTAQSFPVLLHWWAQQNKTSRHLWPGMAMKSAVEVRREIEATRAQPGSTGTIFWNIKSLTGNRSGVADELKKKVYAQPALIPASPWLSRAIPAKPDLHVANRSAKLKVSWSPGKSGKAWLWVLQAKWGGQWVTTILPNDKASTVLKVHDGSAKPEAVALCAVDRFGNISPPTVAEVK